MNTRRHFFQQLASGLIAATAPGLFLPRLIKPGWKAAPKIGRCEFTTYESRMPLILCGIEIIKDPETGLAFLHTITKDGRSHVEVMHGSTWESL